MPSTGFRDQPRGKAALLIIDMINPLDFEGAEAAAPRALAAARRIKALRAAASKARIPTVYVNDNFGQWHSEQSRLIEHCQSQGGAAADLTSILAPRKDDFFVIKPMHSGFYATNLPVLLPKLGASRLILTGMATEICVLFTAADAHMRDNRLWVPSDCTTHANEAQGEAAMAIMASAFRAHTAPAEDGELARWLKQTA